MIHIVTDSSSDLPAQLAERHGISVVPLTIRFGEEEFVDRVDMGPGEFWRKLQRAETLPETAAPSAGSFQDAFRASQAAGATGVVAVCLSSALSGTYQSARIAAEALVDQLPVRVVDSRLVSMALGLVAVQAARLAEAGADLDQVTEAALRTVPKANVFAALDTLEFLKRGGRIGSAQAFLGGLLSVKPLITLQDGVVAAADRVRTRRKALAAIAARVGELADQLEELVLMTGGGSEPEELAPLIAPFVLTPDRLIHAELGPVVGTHSGPGVIGVAYRTA